MVYLDMDLNVHKAHTNTVMNYEVFIKQSKIKIMFVHSYVGSI